MTTATTSESLYQSRWGYHPCSYLVFRKIKRYRHLLVGLMHRLAAMYRNGCKTVHRQDKVSFPGNFDWHLAERKHFRNGEHCGSTYSPELHIPAWFVALCLSAYRPHKEPVAAFSPAQLQQLETELASLEAWFGDNYPNYLDRNPKARILS